MPLLTVWAYVTLATTAVAAAAWLVITRRGED
jgi:hypothetical protein